MKTEPPNLAFIPPFRLSLDEAAQGVRPSNYVHTNDRTVISSSQGLATSKSSAAVPMVLLLRTLVTCAVIAGASALKVVVGAAPPALRPPPPMPRVADAPLCVLSPPWSVSTGDGGPPAEVLYDGNCMVRAHRPRGHTAARLPLSRPPCARD